jgi:hypothetical protein
MVLPHLFTCRLAFLPSIFPSLLSSFPPLFKKSSLRANYVPGSMARRVSMLREQQNATSMLGSRRRLIDRKVWETDQNIYLQKERS